MCISCRSFEGYTSVGYSYPPSYIVGFGSSQKENHVPHRHKIVRRYIEAIHARDISLLTFFPLPIFNAPRSSQIIRSIIFLYFYFIVSSNKDFFRSNSIFIMILFHLHQDPIPAPSIPKAVTCWFFTCPSNSPIPPFWNPSPATNNRKAE